MLRLVLPLLLCLSACQMAPTPHAHADIASLRPADNLEQYQQLSDSLRAIDDQALRKELNTAGLTTPKLANYTKRFGFNPSAPRDFYATDEGRRIADVLLSFQTPSGGWSKRTDMGQQARQTGQAYGVEENYIPTFDNDATSTQIWVLARAYQATGERRYADAAIRAVRLMVLAQYPNGGWPQNFPLSGGYHDDVTYNDNVTSNILTVLNAARTRQAPLDFIPAPLAAQAQHSFERGLAAVVATQVLVANQPTIWAAQYDAISLTPSAARKYEPAALAAAESAELVEFLMTLDNPPAAIRSAIISAHRWFTQHQIHGYRWEQRLREHSRLVKDPDAGPLWARFYEIGSNKPVFGDRDGSIHYSVDNLALERQLGYGWYSHQPRQILQEFADWQVRTAP